MTKEPPRDTPKALDAIADVVLAYKPKVKTDAAKSRKKRRKSLQKTKVNKECETRKN